MVADWCFLLSKSWIRKGASFACFPLAAVRRYGGMVSKRAGGIVSKRAGGQASAISRPTISIKKVADDLAAYFRTPQTLRDEAVRGLSHPASGAN
jgi:hypothetical protein